MSFPVPIPLVFTPLKGLMAVADGLACMLERRFHFQMWHGAEGLRGVIEQKLVEVGVPDQPIPIVSNPLVSNPLVSNPLTPRVVAEQTGFIKRKKRMRRVK